MVMQPPERIDQGDYMAFIPEDVLNKNFTATQFRRGYDEHEVDDFLDEIVVEMRRLSADNDDLSKKLQTCQEDKGVISPEAKGKIAAARASAEEAERESADRIAKAMAQAEEAESQAAQRAKAAEEAAAQSAAAASAKEGGRDSAEVGGAVAAGVGSAAGVLALAEKLHAQYVSEGQETRERLIDEGQSVHDQVIGEATAKQEELRSTAQAKHDALIAEATARHEQLITEARERSTGMVAEAQQKRAEVLQSLGQERSLLQRKIDELRTFERDYRARLKSHLEGQLQQLEETGANGQSANDSEGNSEGTQPPVDLSKQETQRGDS
jgi:DivIVA domain-containing protein